MMTRVPLPGALSMRSESVSSDEEETQATVAFRSSRRRAPARRDRSRASSSTSTVISSRVTLISRVIRRLLGSVYHQGVIDDVGAGLPHRDLQVLDVIDRQCGGAATP